MISFSLSIDRGSQRPTIGLTILAPNFNGVSTTALWELGSLPADELAAVRDEFDRRVDKGNEELACMPFTNQFFHDGRPAETALPGLRILGSRQSDDSWGYGCLCCSKLLLATGDKYVQLNCGRLDFALMKCQSTPKFGNIKRHCRSPLHLKALQLHFEPDFFASSGGTVASKAKCSNSDKGVPTTKE